MPARLAADQTRYSGPIVGDQGNYGWEVECDYSAGYLGISQNHGADPLERVLLSPDQVRQIVAFYRKYRRIK